MVNWIIIVGAYAAGMGLFHVLGGLRAAGQVFERWGSAVGNSRRASVTSSG